MEKFFLAALQGVRGLGGIKIRRLTDYFGSAGEVWRASGAAIKAAGILDARGLEELLAVRREQPGLPERLQELCGHRGISLCSQEDEAYPELLREIHNPPAVLFYRGRLVGDRPRIAMVGSRRVSAYGRNVAENLGSALAGRGFTVVSGAAAGVDTCSHQGALQKGVTEAVLGCGVDVAYPPGNGRLLAEIAEKGAVLSEYLPGTKPLAGNFPARNRIISGMCLGTVVVEAAQKSGSLITAELALSEGRDVFAVPGSIFSPVSKGCNRLIQQGAKLVIDSRDIIEEYPEFAKKHGNRKNNDEKNKTHAIITEKEEDILHVLSCDEPLSIDEVVCRLQGGSAADAAFTLLQMEFKGLVRSDDLHRYVRTVKEGVL